MGYYDPKTGAWIGDAGQSEADRTRDAINYYSKTPGMETQLQNAMKWSEQSYKPATTTATAYPAATNTNTVKTSSPSNTIMGGAYQGTAGQSDYDRTGSAIDYYTKNNMTDQLNAAKLWAQQNGYTYPAAVPEIPKVPEVIKPPTNPYLGEYNDILSQIQAKYEEMDNGNIEDSPLYDKTMNRAQLVADKGSQSAMEEMNRRGILNSTVTADRVGQIQTDAMTSVLPQLMETIYGINAGQANSLINLAQMYANQANAWQSDQTAQQANATAAKQAEIESAKQQLTMAIEATKSIGYVPNWAASILGVDPGTPAFEATKAAAELETKLQIAEQDNQRALQQTAMNNATSSANNANSVGAANQRAADAAEQEDLQKMNDWVTAQVENDERLWPDGSNYQALYDAWENMYLASYG